MFSKNSSNPALSRINKKGFAYDTSGAAMTINGTINKTLVSLLLLIMSAAYVWFEAVQGSTSYSTYSLVGGIGGFVLALVTIFSPRSSSWSVPIYAVLEGMFLGGISIMFEMRYPGLPMKAVALTMGVMFVMLFLYRSGTIKVTDKLRAGIFAAIGAVFVVYLISWVMGLFGVDIFIHGNSMASIIFSLVVVGIASFSLLIDFDNIAKWSAQGAPKYMEWYGAFGLLVTLIWLYLEMLRLLSKIQSRN